MRGTALGLLVAVLMACDDNVPDVVGAACEPLETPTAGYVASEVSVEAPSDQCLGHSCLVYRLEGDPRASCDEDTDDNCASAAEIEARVYCSCRCNGSPEGEPNCDCPDDYNCVPTLELEDRTESYCVKRGTI